MPNCWVCNELLVPLCALVAACAGCQVCKPHCDDYLEVIAENVGRAGPFPPTNEYRIEIDIGSSHYECSGYFESEGTDHWTCSEGVEAHSRIKWEIPNFFIWRARDTVDVEEGHVKIWREEVLIFDDDINISWQLVNADTTFDPPCGCWGGIMQANLESFEGLEGG